MPRHRVDARQWNQAGEALAAGELTLLGLWAHGATVHMALLDQAANRIGIVSLGNRRGSFPSIGRLHAPAIRLERTIADMSGLEPEDAPDSRPWLDHGRWGVSHPLGKLETSWAKAKPYPFLPVEGESLHQIPVGPVHAGIIEPGHFRFTAQGETVVRLEARLGYVHKGIEKLIQGGDLERGMTLAGRTSGDSTVACQWAYAQAVEAALAVKVPARALYIRAIMAELERLANHLGDFGAICNDAAFAMMLAQAGVLRENVLRAADTCFGHRFMRDCVVPGGVSRDLTAEGVATLQALVAAIRERFPKLVALYDNTASLLDRTVATGYLKPELARQFGAGGFVGRASGRDFDVRRNLAYAPYDELAFEVPARDDGDVNARVWIRIEEIRQSLSLIGQCLVSLPDGPVRAEIPVAGEPREGIGLVEGFRGDILVWLALDAKGRIARCHLRDPSWFQWPLLEAVIEDNIVADFPLCNKSFNCSYSGHDL
ncbi:MAG: NADH-quinone oxidoreductase subunit C [Salaquimonas sp.]|nr:NADH-quinone oxidoreductase subunit C [Salaquimonas sp.]